MDYDEYKQRLIVRQSSLKLAVDLLNREQVMANSAAAIPLKTITDLTKELEQFVFEVGKEEKKTPVKKEELDFG